MMKSFEFWLTFLIFLILSSQSFYDYVFIILHYVAFHFIQFFQQIFVVIGKDMFCILRQSMLFLVNYRVNADSSSSRSLGLVPHTTSQNSISNTAVLLMLIILIWTCVIITHYWFNVLILLVVLMLYAFNLSGLLIIIYFCCF